MREGWLGGIVRLDLNPTALVVARPRDKLTCRLWIYENATWTVVKKKRFFQYSHAPFVLGRS